MSEFQCDGIESTLLDRFEEKSSSVAIADAIANIWEEIDSALHPVIDKRGVAALFHRSLAITAKAYPWLPLPERPLQATDTTPVHAAFLLQESPTIIKCSAMQLQTFHDLLAGLVGSSLTERLLRSVSSNLFDGHRPQDTQ